MTALIHIYAYRTANVVVIIIIIIVVIIIGSRKQRRSVASTRNAHDGEHWASYAEGGIPSPICCIHESAPDGVIRQDPVLTTATWDSAR